MKKRGFTLIELLAVIVILAIIALIATPAVLNIIEDSRKGAAEASARNIVSAAKTYYMSETMNGRTVGTIDLSGDTLKYDGDRAEKGYVSFTNGKPEAKMYIGGYCVEVTSAGAVSSEKKDKDDCEIEVLTESYTKYNDGTPLLYDPINNVKCIDSQVETNVNNYRTTHEDRYGDPTITGLNSGCMKWYAFLDSKDSSTVNLILDHNTTGHIEWDSNFGTTPETLNSQLALDVTNWNADVKNTVRIISANEVNQIAPADLTHTWDINNVETWYYLHTGKGPDVEDGNYSGEAGTNKYAWLFDNTYQCEWSGCNSVDRETYGYWTSSFSLAGDENHAWLIGYDGSLNHFNVWSEVCGIRPVITVSKDVFK